MGNARKAARRGGADTARRTVVTNEIGELRFQILEAAPQRVIGGIVDLRRSVGVIEPVVTTDVPDEFIDRLLGLFSRHAISIPAPDCRSTDPNRISDWRRRAYLLRPVTTRSLPEGAAVQVFRIVVHIGCLSNPPNHPLEFPETPVVWSPASRCRELQILPPCCLMA